MRVYFVINFKSLLVFMIKIINLFSNILYIGIFLSKKYTFSSKISDFLLIFPLHRLITQPLDGSKDNSAKTILVVSY